MFAVGEFVLPSVQLQKQLLNHQVAAAACNGGGGHSAAKGEETRRNRQSFFTSMEALFLEFLFILRKISNFLPFMFDTEDVLERLSAE